MNITKKEISKLFHVSVFEIDFWLKYSRFPRPVGTRGKNFIKEKIFNDEHVKVWFKKHKKDNYNFFYKRYKNANN